MSRIRPVLALAAMLGGIAVTGPVTAGQFQDGTPAYQAGDYATALKDWRPLAKQGTPRHVAECGFSLG